MESPFLRFREQPTLIAVLGIVILVVALALPVLGNQFFEGWGFGFLSPIQITGVVCFNLWVLLAPLGLMMITCGLLGEYCRLRRPHDTPD